MAIEIPRYGMKAYAMLYAKHGTKEKFRQAELDWIVSESMKKKIFSLLLRNKWIKKNTDNTYSCVNPSEAIKTLLEFRVPELLKKAVKDYALTKMSAVEIWSDYSYVQRSVEKSPYFIKILKKDLKYWKSYFNKNSIPCYENQGTTIGEHIILIPVNELNYEEKDGYKTDTLKKAKEYAESNQIYEYAAEYIKNKYKATFEKHRKAVQELTR